MITTEVEALRGQFDLPGMNVLQFAFGESDSSRSFRPHYFVRETVAYTGTHDNETMVGWWKNLAPDSYERNYVRHYLNTDGRDIHWALIRALLSSVADTVVIPLQDILGLDNEARMNTPSSLRGNWQWRYQAEALTPELQTRLRQLTELFDRGAQAFTRADMP